jgi:hypothetical protein
MSPFSSDESLADTVDEASAIDSQISHEAPATPTQIHLCTRGIRRGRIWRVTSNRFIIN